MEWILMIAVLVIGLSFGYWMGRRMQPAGPRGGIHPHPHPEPDEKNMTEHDTYGA
ncbi:MAG: hypothetical protein ACM3NH_05030 [Candidatus Saccharibacteria bacterium]